MTIAYIVLWFDSHIVARTCTSSDSTYFYRHNVLS